MATQKQMTIAFLTRHHTRYTVTVGSADKDLFLENQEGDRKIYKMAEKEETLQKLKKFECPFTWALEKEMEDVIIEHQETKTHDDENLVPILKFMRLTMAGFENCLKGNSTEARDSLNAASEILEIIKEDEDKKHLSSEVLENIFNGTKAHIEFKSENFDKVDKILKTFHEIDFEKDPKARSTLNGCKSIAYSKYKEYGSRGFGKSVEFAKQAIKDSPDFSGWYFILGKNLRRQRRGPSLDSTPWPEELEAMEKAYKLKPKAIYGIYIAVINKEKENYSEALEMYKKVYNMNPESCTINLRLALGFIRSRNSLMLYLAKNCLDFVEKKSPKDCMYLHYRGLYLEACRKYEEAAEYYLKACQAKDYNYGAEMSFLKCKSKLRDRYDFVAHLQKLLKSYEGKDEKIELDIILHLAGSYLLKKDIENAAKFYLRAFEKDPTSKLFKRHHFIQSGPSVDIFSVLRRKLFPQANRKQDLDSYTKQVCLKLKGFCDKRDQDIALDFESLQL